jgi:hypothetical protein
VASAVAITLGGLGLLVGTLPTDSGATTSRPIALAGIGATIAQMTKAHGVSFIKGGLCSAPPHCFGPRVTNSQGKSYLFTGVAVNDGLITAYTQNFANGTSAVSAQRQIARWLPKDATAGPITVIHQGVNSSCGVYLITSPTLASLFATHADVQDPGGTIGVEMDYVDNNGTIIYSPSKVARAELMATGPTVSLPNGLGVQPSPSPAFTPSVGC